MEINEIGMEEKQYEKICRKGGDRDSDYIPYGAGHVRGAGRYRDSGNLWEEHDRSRCGHVCQYGVYASYCRDAGIRDRQLL